MAAVLDTILIKELHISSHIKDLLKSPSNTIFRQPSSLKNFLVKPKIPDPSKFFKIAHTPAAVINVKPVEFTSLPPHSTVQKANEMTELMATTRAIPLMLNKLKA